MSTSIVVAYPTTPEALRAEMETLRGQSFTEPALYKAGVKAIAICRDWRVKIEERRKLLKQDSLEYGRKVDAVAKELTDIVASVEGPLKRAKQAVDDAKERAKREAAEAERRRVEEEIRAKREAEEEQLRQRRKAEEAELAEKRRELEAARAQMAAEREAMVKAKAELDAEREAAAKGLAEVRARKEAERRDQEAKEMAARLAAEQEEQRLRQLEYEASKKQRYAALAPDREKLKTFRVCIADLLRRCSEWTCADPELEAARENARALLLDAVNVLDAYRQPQIPGIAP